jgi:hypothetical protein
VPDAAARRKNLLVGCACASSFEVGKAISCPDRMSVWIDKARDDGTIAKIDGLIAMTTPFPFRANPGDAISIDCDGCAPDDSDIRHRRTMPGAFANRSHEFGDAGQ